jgi:hypothetical protein
VKCRYHTADVIARLSEQGIDVVPDRELAVAPEHLSSVLERCLLRRDGCDECDLPPWREQDCDAPEVPF